MKKTKILIYALLALSMTSCNYLDIVPDERQKEEDAWKTREQAQANVFSCYSFIPVPHYTQSSLDFLTGDEVYTGYEHETFAKFPQGNFNAASPVISYWNQLYNGIRQCYITSGKLPTAPGLTDEERKQLQGELDFLVGYYHMLLFRCYGPVIVVDGVANINDKPENYLTRSSLKQTVDFITAKFDAAAKVLPAVQTTNNTGRGTSTAALALKAYTLMYYASPLFNGNETMASKLLGKDGSPLMEGTYDAQRWQNAKQAYKAAIDAAAAAGFGLFDEETKALENKYPVSKTLRVLRANLVTPVRYNKEEIWTIYNGSVEDYGLQKKSMPWSNSTWNGVAPTITMLQRFYTKNGLPWDVDPTTKNVTDIFKPQTASSNPDAPELQRATITFANGDQETVIQRGQTSQMNFFREPRYYAWVAFHNGYYEVTNNENQPGYNNNQMDDKMRLKCNFLAGQNCGYSQDRGRDVSKTGFLSKKGVNPDNIVGSKGVTVKGYPWPLIRLGELYLSYAECCVETGDLEEAKTYLNMIRQRAGIPSVEESWENIAHLTLDQERLRSIVRNERQIELFLENQNFWDMRRWLLADMYFNVKPHGMNIKANIFASFSKDTEVTEAVRSFTSAHWLLPIPSTDMNANHNITQNPGY